LLSPQPDMLDNRYQDKSDIWITFGPSVNVQSTYWRHDCSLNFDNGHTGSSCSFTAPFKSGGEYISYATLSLPTAKSDPEIVVIAKIKNETPFWFPVFGLEST
jgi:hypothetical protein